MSPWNEALVFGWREFVAMGIAHAIILGIAVFRYIIRPWLRSRLESADKEMHSKMDV